MALSPLNNSISSGQDPTNTSSVAFAQTSSPSAVHMLNFENGRSSSYLRRHHLTSENSGYGISLLHTSNRMGAD
ncbi:hypothetical protein CCR75_002463 [Bremia lactucae]|uniref:Uncharacterized protein n=1 Tax=Bremia lactucae TaxID=4779 RepID=A0A976FD57_BRELC|nr:hypothetical protein CCR75_002463 [Bremia lactucae]